MSDVQWYYARENRQEGPVSLEALAAMVGRGELAAGDLVWAEGMPQWIEAGKVPALFAQAAGAAPVMAYHAVNTPEGQFGGFWLRVAAYIIDYAILAAAGGAVMMVLGVVVGVIITMANGQASPAMAAITLLAELVIWIGVWLYFALMESSRMQATVGKMVLRLKVTNLEGGGIGFGRASGRFFGKILSGWILMIGFMMAGWTQRKQALHDMMAGTLVLRK